MSQSGSGPVTLYEQSSDSSPGVPQRNLRFNLPLAEVNKKFLWSEEISSDPVSTARNMCE